MDSYEVVMTPDSIADLIELRDYIADVLLVPETALSYIRSVRQEIAKSAAGALELVQNTADLMRKRDGYTNT